MKKVMMLVAGILATGLFAISGTLFSAEVEVEVPELPVEIELDVVEVEPAELPEVDLETVAAEALETGLEKAKAAVKAKQEEVAKLRERVRERVAEAGQEGVAKTEKGLAKAQEELAKEQEELARIKEELGKTLEKAKTCAEEKELSPEDVAQSIATLGALAAKGIPVSHALEVVEAAISQRSEDLSGPDIAEIASSLSQKEIKRPEVIKERPEEKGRPEEVELPDEAAIQERKEKIEQLEKKLPEKEEIETQGQQHREELRQQLQREVEQLQEQLREQEQTQEQLQEQLREQQQLQDYLK